MEGNGVRSQSCVLYGLWSIMWCWRQGTPGRWWPWNGRARGGALLMTGMGMHLILYGVTARALERACPAMQIQKSFVGPWLRTLGSVFITVWRTVMPCRTHVTSPLYPIVDTRVGRTHRVADNVNGTVRQPVQCTVGDCQGRRLLRMGLP